MLIRSLIIAAVTAAIWSSVAWASPYDGMTVEQIRNNPDFVADTYSLSSALNSGAPDADHIYWWIGYIPDGDKRIYFTSFGEALTCVKWEKTDEWVPEWVVEALNRLVDEGYITL